MAEPYDLFINTYKEAYGVYKDYIMGSKGRENFLENAERPENVRDYLFGLYVYAQDTCDAEGDDLTSERALDLFFSLNAFKDVAIAAGLDWESFEKQAVFDRLLNVANCKDQWQMIADLEQPIELTQIMDNFNSKYTYLEEEYINTSLFTKGPEKKLKPMCKSDIREGAHALFFYAECAIDSGVTEVDAEKLYYRLEAVTELIKNACLVKDSVFPKHRKVEEALTQIVFPDIPDFTTGPDM